MEIDPRLLSADELARFNSQTDESSLKLATPIWVRLAKLPSLFSHNQALLLCQNSQDEWSAWIPDFGEATLHPHEFYFASEWN
jgi:hypothetical protein